MWISLIALIFRVMGLFSSIRAWLQKRNEQKEIYESVNAYKKESEIYAAPARDKSAVSDQLRKDRDN